ncbi:MAG: hypothetical protein JWP89_1135 [Schlesneria sp.]|nr:hypothetical protein [Schlesneria sp.]
MATSIQKREEMIDRDVTDVVSVTWPCRRGWKGEASAVPRMLLWDH